MVATNGSQRPLELHIGWDDCWPDKETLPGHMHDAFVRPTDAHMYLFIRMCGMCACGLHVGVMHVQHPSGLWESAGVKGRVECMCSSYCRPLLCTSGRSRARHDSRDCIVLKAVCF